MAAAIPSLVVVLATAFLVLVAPAASAQQTSAEDQYVDTGPTGNGVDDVTDNSPGSDSSSSPGIPATPGSPGASGSPTEPGDPGGDVVKNATGDGETSGGSLPFTDYPTTPLVDLALLLIVIAIAVGIGKRIVAVARPEGTSSP